MLAFIAEMYAEVHKIFAKVGLIAASILCVGIKGLHFDILIGAVEETALAVDAKDHSLFVLGYKFEGTIVLFKGRNKPVKVALMEYVLKLAVFGNCLF